MREPAAVTPMASLWRIGGERGGKELGFAMENRTAFSDFWENALFWFLKKLFLSRWKERKKLMRHVPG